ncbi:hypothetical protein [Nostoc sp. 106C]|uniref:hypothetical protein n=1 Tax=Nostoc sp. 106C TaxID=1932667 RepID=UPI0014128B1E|nr:hypothetical protein [Nostoc sp. 106C]
MSDRNQEYNASNNSTSFCISSISNDRLIKCDIYDKLIQHLRKINFPYQNHLIHREPQLIHNEQVEVAYQRVLIHRERDLTHNQRVKVLYQ